VRTEQLVLPDGFGHDVAGGGWEAGAFQLDGAVLNAEFLYSFPNCGDYFFTFVHVHVWNPSVAAQGVVFAAEGPDMNVMHFPNVLDGQDRSRHFLDPCPARPTLQQDVRGFPQNAD
jgi:hypothetical protein